MKTLHVLSLAGILALLVAAAADDRQAAPGADAGKLPTGGLMTLWLLDGQANCMNLITGAPSGVVQEHEVRISGQHLDFGSYNAGAFSVGIQGGEEGRIIDLGTEVDLRKRFAYEDTVGPKQGFASLHIADGHFMIRKESDSATGQPCTEADKVFEDATSCDHAPVALDHVYVVRIDDPRDPEPELLVKLHVIGLLPDQSATVRWETLSR